MTINASKEFNKILLFILVLLPIYQDSPLSKYLGAAGYTIVMPLSLILIVLYVLIFRRLPKNEYLTGLVKLGIGMTIVSFAAIPVWLISGHNIVVASEFLPVKALKVNLEYFSYPAYVALLVILTRKTGTKAIGEDSFITLIILTIICLIEKQQSPYAFQNLHFSGIFPYWRIRLLTTEASWTAMMIYVYTALSLYWAITYKKRVAVVISIICAATLILNTGSKTLMASIAITAVVYVVVAFRTLSMKKILGVLIMAFLLLAFSYTILPVLSGEFANDIENYSSTATRLYTSIVGLIIGIIIPCGAGGAVSVGVYQSMLLRLLPWFQRRFQLFSVNEIVAIATSQTDEAVTVKSGILNQNMYWGIVGTIIFFAIFVKVTRELTKNNVQNSTLLIVTFWTIVILLFAGGLSFEFWLILGFLICVNEQYKRNINQLQGEI